MSGHYEKGKWIDDTPPNKDPKVDVDQYMTYLIRHIHEYMKNFGREPNVLIISQRDYRFFHWLEMSMITESKWYPFSFNWYGTCEGRRTVLGLKIVISDIRTNDGRGLLTHEEDIRCSCEREVVSGSPIERLHILYIPIQIPRV